MNSRGRREATFLPEIKLLTNKSVNKSPVFPIPMIESITGAVIKAFELAPRYLAVVGIATGFVLFGSQDAVKALGLTELAQNYRPWIGGSFIISTSLVAVFIFIATKDWIFTRWNEARQIAGIKKSITKRLHSLTEDEKQILRFYIAENTRANTLKIDDGVVQGLVSARIIYRSASMGNMLEGFAHNISDFVWEYLHEHPDLLVGATNTYRTDKRLGMW